MPSGLWAVYMAQWFVALVAFRIFMTWIYSHTRSLLLAMLLHAGFSGGQALLWPDGSTETELVWYGLFAVALWMPSLSRAHEKEPRIRRAVRDHATTAYLAGAPPGHTAGF